MIETMNEFEVRHPRRRLRAARRHVIERLASLRVRFDDITTGAAKSDNTRAELAELDRQIKTAVGEQRGLEHMANKGKAS